MARADRLTIRQKKRKVYSDLFNNFSKDEFSGNLSVAENEDAVRQAFRNMVLTNHGERYMDAEKGGNINSYLFENVTPALFEQMKFDLNQTAKAYSPRVTVQDILIPNYNTTDLDNFGGEATQLDNNTITVRIVFTVNNLPDPLSVDVNVRRIR